MSPILYSWFTGWHFILLQRAALFPFLHLAKMKEKAPLHQCDKQARFVNLKHTSFSHNYDIFPAEKPLPDPSNWRALTVPAPERKTKSAACTLQLSWDAVTIGDRRNIKDSSAPQRNMYTLVQKARRLLSVSCKCSWSGQTDGVAFR